MAFMKFLQSKESKLRDRLFVGRDLGGGELALVNNAEMDCSDGVGVVIQQGKGPLDEATLDRKFLLEFPHQRPLIRLGIKSLPQPIAVIDMTTYPNRTLFEQTLLSGSAPASVVKEFSPRGHDDIGDKLLERGVLLSLGTWDEKMIPLLQKVGKVSADLGIQSVEGSETIEEGTADDEDLFGRRHKMRLID